MQAIAQRILLLHGWRRALVALVAGALTALAQAPFHLFAVGFVTFPVLVWLLDGATGATPGRPAGALRSAFAIGWLFGFGYFTAGLWWIANALLVEAPEFAWAIPLAVTGIPALLAVFWGLGCVLARLVWSDGVGRIAALAVGLGLAEWARTFVLTGFPWNAIGYALMPSPVMMQSIVLGGLFAMNAAAVLVFALPAQLGAERRRSAAAALVLCAVLLAGHVGFGVWRLGLAPDRAAIDAEAPVIRLVQPAIAQQQKMDASARQDTFTTLLDLSALDAAPASSAETGAAMAAESPRRPDIVIWPETSVPYLLTREAAALAAIGDTLGPEQMLLTGAVREEPGEEDGTVTGRYYNSVMAVSGDGVIAGAADKVHLVPFGEYLPLAPLFERIGLNAVAAADRGYSAAPARAVIDLPGGPTVLPLICYEAIFPHLSAAPAGSDVDAIVNVTNDAWFGRTPGPWQHMHQSRLRAVETGLPLVRVANNGISIAVDPFGRALARIGHDERAVADVQLPAPTEPLRLGMGRHGNFWLFLATLTAIALAGRAGWGASRGRP
ncbi:apolipoprotein N-acyltransferase [Roseitalea porphyridii]|uniref:Apolipoprotein N-acyltransferase n=1 Tax=Roseitalea porphyridii TaxID=1852022 RepID=A0A4P6UX69_9HYPH|nr:apolipoprotein N-acyltransferase [Roseitalea porphyridii]QBK29671.1 apolipoprotein N-acyltransferase [Roseitalea porphyridii]